MARSNGDGGLYKDSRGLWNAVVELPEGFDRKRRRKVVRRKSKSAALEELKRLKDEYSKYGDLSTSSNTMEKWVRYWIDEILPGTVAPSTYTMHVSSAEAYIIPLLGKIKLDKINAFRVREFHKQLEETPVKKELRELKENQRPVGYKTLGKHTMRSIHSTLSQCFEAAVAERKINTNPAKLVGLPKGGDTGTAKAMSIEGVKRLLVYLTNHRDGAMWVTYLLTGARRGEVVGIERDRVSDVLDMSWQLQYLKPESVKAARTDYEMRHVEKNVWLTRPKSSAGWRILPLVEPLKSILDLHLQNFEGDGLIFRPASGAKSYLPNNVSKMWRSLLDEAGIDEDVNLHGTRHTLIDLLYDAGVSEQVIQQIVGHSSVKMTRSYKTRVNQGQAKLALESLGKLISE